MNFLALLPIFTNLINRLIPDKAQQDQAQLAMQQALNQAQAEQDSAKKDIITAEITKDSWASNWRAYLMMACVAIISYNWVIVSLLNAFMKPLGIPIESIAVPPEMWTLVTVGLGGYIGRETVSNYTQAKYGPANDDKFFAILRQKIFKSGMTQDQVNALEDALKARDNG